MLSFLKEMVFIVVVFFFFFLTTVVLMILLNICLYIATLKIVFIAIEGMLVFPFSVMLSLG